MRNWFNKSLIKLFCLLLVVFSISGCSNSTVKSNTSDRTINGCSKEAQAIIYFLEPDERITAVLEAQEIISNLDWDKKKKLQEGLEELNVILEKYELQSALDSLEYRMKQLEEPANYAELNLNNNDEVNDFKSDLESTFCNYIFPLIIEVYKDQHKYEYPVNIDIANFDAAATNAGYSYKITSKGNEVDYYLPKDVTTDDKGDKKALGTHIKITYDNNGNIIRIDSLPPLIIYGMTDDDYVVFFDKSVEDQRKITIENTLANLKCLKVQGIKNNDILPSLLDKEEITKFELFLEGLTLEDLNKSKAYYFSDEDCNLRYKLNFTDKSLILVMSCNNISIGSVYSKNYINSQYNKDIWTLENAFIKDNTKADSGRSINDLYYEIDMSTFSVQTSEADTLNKETLKQKMSSSDAELLVEQFVDKNGSEYDGYFHVMKETDKGFEVGFYLNKIGEDYYALYEVYDIDSISKEVKLVE